MGGHRQHRRGHDASYPFKTIGAANGATIIGERDTCRRWRKAASPPTPRLVTAPPTSASATGHGAAGGLRAAGRAVP